MPPLTEIKLRAIKPGEKVQRYYDTLGMYLEVTPSGGKYWRLKYRIDGKEKRAALGVWPEVSLKQARDKRDDLRKLIASGNAPSSAPAHNPGCQTEGTQKKFKDVAEAWRMNMGNVWADSHAITVQRRLELDAYPALGDADIAQIAPQDVLAMLRKIEERKAYETAQRVLGICSQVFRYGVAIGAVTSDPCRDLRGALVPHATQSLAAITAPKEVGALMLGIDDYKGSAIVRAALKLSALTFARPGEIRHAEWGEIDFEEREWRIPAEKMKARREHRIPLSRQALEVLEGLRPLTGHGRYVFPGPRKWRPLSENGVTSALRRMGYTSEEMTAHGFRSMASTLLNELGEFRADVIEAQLAHKNGDSVRAIYNRAAYMDERRAMMQKWADYLDGLRAVSAGASARLS
ncbi:MAG: tyrosine-type recombinase/integrase [Desulfovibrio sp.]|uniref:tyrosine-type recombinase/integrase n=1 Tax=Desulfovibrio sp. TaxID=885 RepID=UPI002A35C065|nr:integrase arm-type DNA-binding domain-containing protein [Desulfovibrio sp.]MDY0258467.1 tyrosine-type recombinase/integrase [Desulfovibrio sp.]